MIEAQLAEVAKEVKGIDSLKSEAKDYYQNLSKNDKTNLDNPLSKELSQNAEQNNNNSFGKHCPINDSKIGNWSGERGNSDFTPSGDYRPPNEKCQNPENLSLKEIFKKYGIDAIKYINGYPDFSPVSKGEVEIDMTKKRYGIDGNFSKADEALAKQKGCTPDEVKKWRQEHNYTWHECENCKTMQKVPQEIHGNIPHQGGVSIIKERESKINE